jgi:prevent-host-death family protein
MSTIEPLRHVKDHLSDYVERVNRYSERVMITRNGRPAAMLVNADELRSLEETIEILSDPVTMAEIRQGQAAADAGDVYTLDQVNEAVHARRRSA